MEAVVRVEFNIKAPTEDAIFDSIADLTHELRTAKNVSGYVEEIVDLD